MALRLGNHGQPVQWTLDPDGYLSSTIDTRGVDSIKLTSWEGQVLCAKTPREPGHWTKTMPAAEGFYWLRRPTETPGTFRLDAVSIDGRTPNASALPTPSREHWRLGDVDGEWWSERLTVPSL